MSRSLTKALYTKTNVFFLENNMSHVKERLAGVPQSSIMVLLLYIRHWNYIPITLNNTIGTFADDISVLITVITVIKAKTAMQKAVK